LYKTLKWVKREKEKCALNIFNLTNIIPYNNVPFTEIEWMDLYCIDIISPVHQPQPDLNHIDLRQLYANITEL